MDSGFHINLDSGFQSTGYRIPIAKLSWIPDSVTWGDSLGVLDAHGKEYASGRSLSCSVPLNDT